MMLRPASASWFELLTSREELGAVLDCLAITGSVQLQAYSRSGARLPLPDLRNTLTDYETLAKRYGHYWPAAKMQPPTADHPIIEVPREACERLKSWARAADPLIAEIESVESSRAEIELLRRLTKRGVAELPRLDHFAAAGPVLAGRIYVCDANEPLQGLPPSVMSQQIPAEKTTFVLAIGPRQQIAELDQAMAARKARVLELPEQMPAEPGELAGFLEQRRESMDDREARAREELAGLNESHEVADALGDLALASWLVAHVPELPVTEHFAWVTGWCSDPDETRLCEALDRRGLHYLLRLTEAPEGELAPTVLHNPLWARPFEVFSGLMGIPGTREADPTFVVALLAPLMFGYMFGDVAQGLALIAIGFALRHKLPTLKLLVPGGAVAVVFGFAFGSLLAREDLIPAFWLHPLEEPLLVLGTALGFGAVVITLGLLLDALQHLWRGQGRKWLASDAGLLCAYLGVLGATQDARALWALPLGIAWVIGGAALVSPNGALAAAGQAAGELVERILQLAVNTISFVRVGAFALAHAGLCTAVVGIAEAAGPGYWPVLILGNAVIVALEGLVVGIQTTRLILFEFFIRFLSAQGRRFEPLPPPTGTTIPTSGSTP
jgi:V/A-type H+-transporting ATPase subunit I